MQRPTHVVDLGRGYTATVINYFTQGERFSMGDLYGQLAEAKPLKDKDGNETGYTFVRGVGYQQAIRELVYRTAVLSIKAAEGEEQIADVLTAIMCLPEECFKVLDKAILALTPSEDEKKGNTTT